MSLFIVTESFGQTQKIEWHVGDSSKDIKVSLIREVSADMDELNEIRDHMSKIPMANKRQVTWFGDMAKFIAVNIGAVDLDD
jgi:hypothetical protein